MIFGATCRKLMATIQQAVKTSLKNNLYAISRDMSLKLSSKAVQDHISRQFWPK